MSRVLRFDERDTHVKMEAEIRKRKRLFTFHLFLNMLDLNTSDAIQWGGPYPL